MLLSYPKAAKYIASTDSHGNKSFQKLKQELVRLGSLPADTEFTYEGNNYRVLQESRYHNVSLTNGNVQVVNVATHKSGTLPRRYWVEVVNH